MPAASVLQMTLANPSVTIAPAEGWAMVRAWSMRVDEMKLWLPGSGFRSGNACSPASCWVRWRLGFGAHAETWFGPLGDLYVTLIKMIAVPLVFFAVINAVSSLTGRSRSPRWPGAPLSGSRSRPCWRWLWVCVRADGGAGVGVGVLQVAATTSQRRFPGCSICCSTSCRDLFQALSGPASGRPPTAQGAGAAQRHGVQVIFFAGLVGFAFVKLGGKSPACAGSPARPARP